MKRLVSAFLAGAMALSLAACGGAASTSTAASSAAASASAAPASSAVADSDLAYLQSNGKMVIGYTVYGYRTVSDADGNFLYETAEPGGVYYLHTEDIAWPAEKLNEDDYIDALEQLYRAG